MSDYVGTSEEVETEFGISLDDLHEFVQNNYVRLEDVEAFSNRVQEISSNIRRHAYRKAMKEFIQVELHSTLRLSEVIEGARPEFWEELYDFIIDSGVLDSYDWKHEQEKQESSPSLDTTYDTWVNSPMGSTWL